MLLGAIGPVEVLVVVVLLVLVWIVPAWLVARVAQRRGRSFALWMVFGLFLGWPFLLVGLVFLRTRPEAQPKTNSG